MPTGDAGISPDEGKDDQGTRASREHEQTENADQDCGDERNVQAADGEEEIDTGPADFMNRTETEPEGVWILIVKAHHAQNRDGAPAIQTGNVAGPCFLNMGD